MFTQVVFNITHILCILSVSGNSSPVFVLVQLRLICHVLAFELAMITMLKTDL